MTLALLLTLLWNEGLSAIFSIIFAISAQVTPSVFTGLFAHPKYPLAEIHPWVLASAAWTGTICLLAYYFNDGYQDKALAFNLDPAFGMYIISSLHYALLPYPQF